MFFWGLLGFYYRKHLTGLDEKVCHTWYFCSILWLPIATSLAWLSEGRHTWLFAKNSGNNGTHTLLIVSFLFLEFLQSWVPGSHIVAMWVVEYLRSESHKLLILLPCSFIFFQIKLSSGFCFWMISRVLKSFFFSWSSFYNSHYLQEASCDHLIPVPLLLINFNSGKNLRHVGWGEVFVYLRYLPQLSPFFGL